MDGKRTNDFYANCINILFIQKKMYLKKKLWNLKIKKIV